MFDRSSLVLHLVTWGHSADYPGFAFTLLSTTVVDAWKGRSERNSRIFIDLRGCEQLASALTGRHVIAFLGSDGSSATSGSVLSPTTPVTRALWPASVSLIRELDSLIGRPRRLAEAFPEELVRDVIDGDWAGEVAVLVAVSCSRTRRSHFLRYVRVGRDYLPSRNAELANTTGLPVVTCPPAAAGNGDLLDFLSGQESFSRHHPSCPHCGWSDVHRCARCGAIHCWPRDGETFMGNGRCVGAPDLAETIVISCPRCSARVVHEHRYYAGSRDVRRPIIDGDEPVPR
jgi:hypothetical protein